MREKVAGGLLLFNRGESAVESNGSVKSKDRSGAIIINKAMVKHFDETWSNEYEQTDLPNSLAEFAKGAEAAYGAKITAIRPTSRRGSAFNGVNVGGRNFINVESDVSFINITGHET